MFEQQSPETAERLQGDPTTVSIGQELEEENIAIEAPEVASKPIPSSGDTDKENISGAGVTDVQETTTASTTQKEDRGGLTIRIRRRNSPEAAPRLTSRRVSLKRKKELRKAPASSANFTPLPEPELQAPRRKRPRFDERPRTVGTRKSERLSGEAKQSPSQSTAAIQAPPKTGQGKPMTGRRKGSKAAVSAAAAPHGTTTGLGERPTAGPGEREKKQQKGNRKAGDMGVFPIASKSTGSMNIMPGVIIQSSASILALARLYASNIATAPSDTGSTTGDGRSVSEDTDVMTLIGGAARSDKEDSEDETSLPPKLRRGSADVRATYSVQCLV